jgi:signal peptidase I
MGAKASNPITLQSVDNLPRDMYCMYLEKAKHSINDQYDSNTSTIYFPCYAGSTIYMDLGGSYYIKYDTAKKFDGELAAYCKELIQRPYIIVGRNVHLVENYDCAH